MASTYIIVVEVGFSPLRDLGRRMPSNSLLHRRNIRVVITHRVRDGIHNSLACTRACDNQRLTAQLILRHIAICTDFACDLAGSYLQNPRPAKATIMYGYTYTHRHVSYNTYYNKLSYLIIATVFSIINRISPFQLEPLFMHLTDELRPRIKVR